MVVGAEVVNDPLWRHGHAMSFPTPKPLNAFTARSGTNQQAEAAQTVRTMRHGGMQETTAGTLMVRRRFFPSPDQTLPFVNIFTQTSPTGGTWKTGKVFLAGVDTAIGSVPASLSSVTTTTLYWVKHDFAAATAVWYSGTAYPAPSDTYEIYRMLEITCTASVITSFICPHPCDIHATAKST